MLSFFGLNEQPFSVSPNPRFFYMSPNHKAIMAKIQFVLDHNQGLTAIFGEVGSGKSILLRTLFENLQEKNFTVIMIPTPLFRSEAHMLRTVCGEFDIPMKRSHHAQLDEFQKYLIQSHINQSKPVILLDESQILKPKMLELLRFFSNFETNEAKLVQIVLAGQSEFKTRLKKHRALWSRTIMSSSLEAFSFDETVEMIQYRFCDVAKGSPSAFTPEALERIYVESRGIPRDTVNICLACLNTAFINKKKHITKAIVDFTCKVAEKI